MTYNNIIWITNGDFLKSAYHLANYFLVFHYQLVRYLTLNHILPMSAQSYFHDLSHW